MRYILVLLTLLTPAMGWAQNGGQPGERLRAMRAAYLTERIGLTTAEAESFWPVYNAMQEEMDDVRDQKRQIFDSHRGDADLSESSESEILRDVNLMLELEQEELDIKKKYHQRYLEVLSARKVALLYHSEEMFKRELLRRAGRHRERVNNEERRMPE